MKGYIKPMVIKSEDVAESVYMASGSECYTVNVRFTQLPQLGNEVYIMQIDAAHNASHHSTGQVLTLTFNQSVEFVGCTGNGAYHISGTAANVIKIGYTYHSNNTENIGLGSLTVKYDSGLALPVCSLSCNETCNQH